MKASRGERAGSGLAFGLAAQKTTIRRFGSASGYGHFAAIRRNRRMTAVGTVETGGDSDEAASLRRAIARLDLNSRLVLVLRYYLDLPYEEVAKTIGVSVGTARVRVHRALRKLRPAFEVEEGFAHE